MLGGLALPVFSQNGPTVADAQAFLDRANAVLLKSVIDGSHAEWLAETDINEDSEATAALLNEQSSTLALQIIEESHRFDKLDLPAAMRRQFMLLQVNAPAAPHDPKLLAEETQLAAQLTGMYGKGKYCPKEAIGNMPAGKCMSVDDVDTFMAKSRDPQALAKVWAGWHAVGAHAGKIRPLHRAAKHRGQGAGLQRYRRAMARGLRHDPRAVFRRTEPCLDAACAALPRAAHLCPRAAYREIWRSG